ALSAIAKIAEEAPAKLEGISSEAKMNMRVLTGSIEDLRLRDDVVKLLPAWEPAAAKHAHDKWLLSEIERLGGKATLEVTAPDWLRSMIGDDALSSFSRIVEIELNERTDGHKEPTPKPLSDRVTDEWLAKIANQAALRRLGIS